MMIINVLFARKKAESDEIILSAISFRCVSNIIMGKNGLKKIHCQADHQISQYSFLSLNSIIKYFRYT